MWMEPSPSFIYNLETHLKLAGINISIDIQQESKPILQLIYESKGTTNLKQVLCLFSPKEDRKDKSHLNENFIDITAYENYYFLLFDILKRVLLNVSLEKIITKFKEKYEAIQNSIDPNSLSYEEESKFGMNKGSVAPVGSWQY